MTTLERLILPRIRLGGKIVGRLLRSKGSRSLGERLTNPTITRRQFLKFGVRSLGTAAFGSHAMRGLDERLYSPQGYKMLQIAKLRKAAKQRRLMLGVIGQVAGALGG